MSMESSVSSSVCAPLGAPPSAPGQRPLLGHALGLRFRPLAFVESLRDRGDVVTIRLGPRTAYFVNSPQLVRELLTTRHRHFGKGGPLYATIRKILGDGLVTSDGLVHRRHRRLMQPTFHRDRLAEYATVMTDAVAATADGWQDGQHLDVPAEMLGLVTTIGVKSLFSAGSAADAVAEVQYALPVLGHGAGKRIRTPIEILYKLPLPGNRRYDDAVRRLDQLTDRIIADYRAAGVQHADLLSMLLAARDEDTGEGLSDREIHDECLTLLLASAETTANTLSWAWYVLSTKPEVERLVQAEVDSVLGGRPATYDDCPKLGYLQRVVMETLRMYTPLWLITRSVDTDVDLGGYRLRADTDVFISPYLIHRNPEVYPDPGHFDPDRWLPDRHGSLQRESYLPFGAGIRQCLGNNFGMIETVIALGTLIGRWQLRAVPGQNTHAKVDGVLHPSPLRMIVERRDR